MFRNAISKKRVLSFIELFYVFVSVIALQLEPLLFARVVVSILLVIYSFVADSRKVMILLLLIMPVASNNSIVGNVSLTIVMVMANTVKNCLFFKKNSGDDKKNGPSRTWLFYALLLLLYSLSVFSFMGVKEQLIYTVKLVAYLLFIKQYIVECVQCGQSYGDVFSSIIRYLGIGMIISLVCAAFSGNLFDGVSRFSFGDLSLANTTGIQSSFVVIGLVLIWFMKKSRKIDYVIALVCIVISFATVSRTAVIMLVVAAFLFLVALIIQGRFVIVFTMVGLLLAGAFVLLQVPAVSSSLESVYDRFQADDISNGRYEIWDLTIEEMSANKKIFAFGAGDYYNLDFKFGKRDDSMAAHNFVLETWVIYGAVGIIIVILLLLFFIKNVVFAGSRIEKKSVIKRIYVLIPLLSLLLGLLYSHHFIGNSNIILFVGAFIPIMICRTTNGGAGLKNEK